MEPPPVVHVELRSLDFSAARESLDTPSDEKENGLAADAVKHKISTYSSSITFTAHVFAGQGGLLCHRASLRAVAVRQVRQVAEQPDHSANRCLGPGHAGEDIHRRQRHRYAPPPLPSSDNLLTHARPPPTQVFRLHRDPPHRAPPPAHRVPKHPAQKKPPPPPPQKKPPAPPRGPPVTPSHKARPRVLVIDCITNVPRSPTPQSTPTSPLSPPPGSATEKMHLESRARRFGSDAEILARAVCSEMGWDALVSRSRRGCLGCAVREAGALGWRVIIRVG